MRSFLDIHLFLDADAGDEPAKQRIAIDLITLVLGGLTIVNPFVASAVPRRVRTKL